jgi:hypothetical protein
MKDESIKYCLCPEVRFEDSIQSNLFRGLVSIWSWLRCEGRAFKVIVGLKASCKIYFCSRDVAMPSHETRGTVQFCL